MSINALGVTTTDLSHQVSNDGVAQAANSKSQPASRHATTEDTTSFSTGTLSVQSLGQAALQTFPSRQTKVEALKQQVSSAEYQLDSAKIAESLINADY